MDWYDNYTSKLYHHGIKGQQWGKRNGPPYPLNSSNHSASEKKAGWRSSLSKNKSESKDLTSNGKKEYNEDNPNKEKKHLTDKQKKAIKIGAAVAATALVTIGAYQLAKSGKIKNLAEMGANGAKGFLAGSADDVFGKFGKLSAPEQISETISKANPNRGNPKYTNNCSACGLAGFLRQQGYDVIAKDTGGQMQNMNGVVEECFKISNRNEYIKDGSAVKFGRSRNDAAEFLLKKFGKNAEGVCSVQWKNGGGHIFNWAIEDGKVLFFDTQNGFGDKFISNNFWNSINPQGDLQVARLDGLEINWDTISKYVE